MAGWDSARRKVEDALDSMPLEVTERSLRYWKDDKGGNNSGDEMEYEEDDAGQVSSAP